MKRLIYVILVMLIAEVGLSPNRRGSAKKVVNIVKKYSGKVFKECLMLRYVDDIVRHLEFQNFQK